MRVFTETRCGSAPAAQDGCPGRTGPRDVDVCLIVEGCYPYRRGGVSNWIDTLLADQSNVNFAVISIQPAQATVPVLYTARSNIRLLQRLELGSIHVSWRWQARRREACQAIANEMVDFIRWGSLQNLQRLIRMCKALAGQRNLSSFVQSKIGWESACVIYRALAPAVSFRDFYWSWRVLFGGLFAVLDHPLPNAAAFHAVSTGFAGLLAARARIETGRPAILTEHGIYTTERMIELFMAQWITEDLDLSLSVQDDRMSLRSFWIRCFESFARACYEASSLIISLFPENQVSQKELGADAAKLRIVPNGVRWQDFAHLPQPGTDEAPTVALIGRVVPFKDVKTFLFAIQFARKEISALKALVVGDLHEDPTYSDECMALASALGLADCVEFTGTVRILEVLPRVHLAVLTSMTESQPLAILEAGAAGICCIATDVGGCRELLLGGPEQQHDIGPGGVVMPAFDADAIGRAIVELLRDPARRQRCAGNLRTRVQRHYDRENVQAAYAAIYNKCCSTPDALDPSNEA